jgi:hypothetical protein
MAPNTPDKLIPNSATLTRRTASASRSMRTSREDRSDLASLPEEARAKLRDVAAALAKDRLSVVNAPPMNGSTNGASHPAEDADGS